MDFALDDAQRLLQDSAARFVRERCGFEAWWRWRQQGLQPGVVLWPEMARLGWLALPFASADGGLDGGPLEVQLVMEALGRGLLAEPYLQAVVQAGAVLRHAPAGAARSARIEAVAEGRCRAALACDEVASRYDRQQVQARAERGIDGWHLHGCQEVRSGAAAADAFIVSARAPAGLTLFWVDATAPGLVRHEHPLVDGGVGATLTLNGLLLDDDALLCEPGGAGPRLDAAADAALAAMGAEAVGLTELLLAQTTAHIRERRQFGQPLAQFQVLRHRLVDMFMQLEQLRSIVLLATLRLAEGHEDLPRALSALKVQLGKVGRFVSQQAVQLHGGMGMTDEIVVGHAFKRLLALDAQLGNVDHHLQRFAALSATRT